MGRDKKYNNLLTLLFSVLVTCTCYADSSNDFSLVKIKDVRLVKKISGGTQIFDVSENGTGNAGYVLSFIAKKECYDPTINLLDATHNPYEIKQTNTYEPLSKKKTAWQIKSDMVGAGSPVFYSISLNGDEGSCKKMDGSMPELKLSLIPSADQDKNRKIVIKNVTSQPIEIIKIIMEKNSNPKAVNAEFNGEPISTAFANRAISIPANGQIDIVLKPGTICTADEVTSEFSLKMEYKIGNEISKDTFGIIVDYSCDWKLERAIKDRDSLRTKLDGCDENLKNDKTALETTNTNLAACRGELETANGNLNANKTVLETTSTNLATCKTVLEAANGNLAASKTALEATNTNLVACRGELETANVSLVARKTALENINVTLGKCEIDLNTCQQQLSDSSTSQCAIELADCQGELAAKLKPVTTKRQN